VKLKVLAAIAASALSITSVYAGSLNLTAEGRLASDLERDASSKPVQIIEFAGIKKGDVVLDILGGGGYYSELLSQVVGDEGKVVLHNNEAYMPYVGKELKERSIENRHHNVTRLNSELNGLGLKANSYDKVVFVLGFHDLYYQDKGWQVDSKSFIKQIRDGLKQGGEILIVDHSAEEKSGTQHAQKLHRIDKDFVIKDMEQNGFKLVKSSDILSNPNDSRKVTPFVPEMRRKTDRFVLLFEKV